MAAKPEAILTEEFRLSFCNLFEPAPDMNGVIRFSMEMLFPKDRGVAQFNEMYRIYNATLAGANFDKIPGPTPRSFKEAIIDGNSKKQEGRHGMFMIKANASAEIKMKDGTKKPNAPRVLLPNRVPATPSDVYEGCWGRAILSAYRYVVHKDANPKLPVISRGAAFNIHVFQKTRDDDPFASFITNNELDDILKNAPIEGAEDDLEGLLD